MLETGLELEPVLEKFWNFPITGGKRITGLPPVINYSARS